MLNFNRSQDAAVALAGKVVAAVEQVTGVTLPKADADLLKLGAALDASGIFLSAATDLAQHMDALVQSFPEDKRQIIHAILWFVDHFVRVGSRMSDTMQESLALLTDIHEHGFEVRIKQS
jgi:hypothetical protein